MEGRGKMENLLQKALAEQPQGSSQKICLNFDAGEAGTFPLTCILMKGLQPGPVLWLQGGLHGDEYEGPVAVLQLWNHLNLSALAGSLILVPVVNPTAFAAIENGSPLDGINLNRVFPGNRRGSFSQRYGYWLFHLIRSVANYHIDLHGGGRFLDVCPFAMISATNDAVMGIAQEMALASGSEYIYQNPAKMSMLYASLAAAGIPAVLLENGGGMSWCNEKVECHLAGVYGILHCLGFLKGVSKYPSKGRTITRTTDLYFEEAGLQTDHVPVGRIVVKDDVLVEVTSIVTLTKHVLRCPMEKGVVLSVHTAAAVKKGDYAVMLGEL